MIEDFASRNAEMSRVRRRQILEVPAIFVDEPKAEFRVGSASTDGKLVATVGQADPVGLHEALIKRPARDDQAPRLAEVGQT